MLSLNLLLNAISSHLVVLNLLLVLSQINAQNNETSTTNTTADLNTTVSTDSSSSSTPNETEPTIIKPMSEFATVASEPTIIQTMSELTAAPSEPTIIQTLSEFPAVSDEPTIIQTVSDFTTPPNEPTIIQTIGEFTTAPNEPTIIEPLIDFTSVPNEPTIIQTMSELTAAPSEPTIIQTISEFTTPSNEPTILQTLSEFPTVPNEPTIIPTMNEFTTVPNEPTILQTMSDLTTAISEPTILQTISEFTTPPSEPTIIATIAEFSPVESEPTIMQTISEFTTPPNEPTIIQTISEFLTAPSEPTIIPTMNEFTTAPNEPTILQTINEFTTPPNEPTIIESMSEFTTPSSEPTIIATIAEFSPVESEPTIIQTLAEMTTPIDEPSLIPTLSELTTPEHEPTIIATESELLTPLHEPTIKIMEEFTAALSEPTVESVTEFATAIPEPTLFEITDFTTGPFSRRTTATKITEPQTTETAATTQTSAPAYDCTVRDNCGIYGKCNNSTKHCVCIDSYMFTVDESNRCAKNKVWCKSNCGDENNCVIITYQSSYKLVCDCPDQQKSILNKTTGECELRSHCGKQEDGRLECDKHKAMCWMDESQPKGYYCQCPKGMHNISGTCVDLCEIADNIQKCYTDYGFCVYNETDAATNALHCECYAGFYRSGSQTKCEMALFTVQLSVIIRYVIIAERFKSSSVYYDSSSVSSGFYLIEQQLNQDIQAEADKTLVISNAVQMIKKSLVDGDIVDVALVNCKPSTSSSSSSGSDKSYETYNCVLTLQLSKSLNESYVERKITEKCVNATISGDNSSYYCAFNGSIYLKKLQTVTDFEPCTQSLNLCQKLSNYSVCAQEIGSTQYQCLCPKGFRAIKQQTTSLGTSINRNDLKLEQCEDIDECAEKLNCSGVHQTCANTIGSYECHCDDTYIPYDIHNDNNGCVSVCAGVDCGPHGSCVPNEKSEYHCQCNDGFSGDKCLIISNKEPLLSVEWIVIISAVSGVLIICLIISGFVFGVRCAKNKSKLVSQTEQNRRTAHPVVIELNGRMHRSNSLCSVTSL